MAKSFMDMGSEAPRERVIVIDALNLGFRWKHQGRTDFADDYMRTVESLASSYNCGSIVIAADWGSSTFRQGIYPEYKGNRKEKYEKQTPAEAEAFQKFIEEMERTLALMDKRWCVLRFKGVEADDIAAYIVQNREQYGIDHIWLMSTDRDWDLLISPNVSRFSYINRKETTHENWSKDHNYSVEEYITIKCLMGDSGDNVPGIPQIGPKRAEGLVKEFGSAFDIYDAAPFSSRYKYMQSLNENIDQLLTNMELMDLLAYCEEAIGSENTVTIDNSLSTYI
jgi:5'-3' exonuclease|tara:strand:+ start:620 stop:1462 length:843 start_codon:yes stop_codon:yes gene_type:complete